MAPLNHAIAAASASLHTQQADIFPPRRRRYETAKEETIALPPPFLTRYPRHYPAMVPVELNSFLSEVTTALRMEKRQSSGGGVSGDEV